jgi:hypothetical protein
VLDAAGRGEDVKQIYIMAHDTARQRALEAVRTAPEGWMVTVSPPTRNGDQNSKFHAICGDISKSRFPWAGKPRDLSQWKVLTVSGHAMATNEGAEIVPGLENEFVNLRESTALMSKPRSASLITYTLAFCDLNGIILSEHMQVEA